MEKEKKQEDRKDKESAAVSKAAYSYEKACEQPDKTKEYYIALGALGQECNKRLEEGRSTDAIPEEVVQLVKLWKHEKEQVPDDDVELTIQKITGEVERKAKKQMDRARKKEETEVLGVARSKPSAKYDTVPNEEKLSWLANCGYVIQPTVMTPKPDVETLLQ